MTQPAFAKYLQQYCDAPAEGYEGFTQAYAQALVIPAYRESPECLHGLLRALQGQLLVLVLNRPDNRPASPQDHALLHTIEQQWQQRWQHPALPTLRLFQRDKHSILVLDHTRDGAPLPARQGVGLARKLGTDICCRLYQHGLLDSHFVFVSDADAELPPDYFSASATLAANTAAAILPYRHRALPPQNAQQRDTLPAILRYELRLRYYEQGLRTAGSPYAFQTIGSTLCINLMHYAMVRGFPKRSAGEDFYLLNKLAKTGTIRTLDKPCIILAARLSTRTPFGTGSALQALADNEAHAEFYHPQIFLVLQDFLQALHRFACAEDVTLIDRYRQEVAGLSAALAHARQHGKDSAACAKHLHDWFDAFRTLKFIHRLRDSRWPSISYEALQAARREPRYRALVPTVTADEYRLTVHTAPS